MSTATETSKATLILDHETLQAKQLAVAVVDKPVPPIWMIFVPVFFVFFASKMRQYKNGLKDFSENYLLSRRWALNAAEEAIAGGGEVAVEPILARVKDIPSSALPLYSSWFLLLARHYQQLLLSPGTSYPMLVRAAYRNKANYLLFCDRLGKSETALNRALLPGIAGEQAEVEGVIDRMAQQIDELRREELTEIFR